MAFPDRPDDADWMRCLADHYASIRHARPDDELCVVFDIDGTILDLRHLMVRTLLSYDRRHGTDLFHGLVSERVTVPENKVDVLLKGLDVPEEQRGDVGAFYRSHLWDEDNVLAASAPYQGVLGVIRWFQIQPGTRVALNTGRTESMRRITLDSLNMIGEQARVRFDPDLLFMRRDLATSVPSAKVAALAEIEAKGLRIVAVVDNEPENLSSMAAQSTGDILYLLADTIFESNRSDARGVVHGAGYELGGLIGEDGLREHVEFVWHGVNDQENLQQFLRSGIGWAEMDLRRDPIGRLVLRHDGFEERLWNRDERPPLARTSIEALAAADRSIKLDVKENGDTLREVLDLIDEFALGDDRVWFNARIDVVGPAAFDAFLTRYPDAIGSCPIDFIVPLLTAAPDEADVVLERLRSWGITRLSVRWGERMRWIIGELEERGWETNIYGVPDLQSFLEAALLLPTSVTADFNFPLWNRFGRGSGQAGAIHRYGSEAVLI